MSKKQCDRIDKIESELQLLLKLQSAASQIVYHSSEKSDDSKHVPATSPPTPLLEIMKPNSQRIRVGSFMSTSPSQSSSRASNPIAPSKNVPYWKRASSTSAPHALPTTSPPRASSVSPPRTSAHELNVGRSDLMLALQYATPPNLAHSNDETLLRNPPTRHATKQGSAGGKENPTEHPRCRSDCKGVCNPVNVSRFRSNKPQLRAQDVSSEKFDRAVAELHRAEERHRAMEQQNSRLRDLLNSNRVVIKENVHSKKVALSVAKQLKDKYEEARAEKYEAREQLDVIKAENSELLQKLAAVTDSNNKILAELKSRRKSSASQDSNLREQLESKEEELRRYKSSMEEQVQKLKADKEREIQLLKNENEYQLSKLDLEKEKELMAFKSELKIVVAKKQAELEREKSLVDKNMDYKQELTMKEEDVKRLATGLTDMTKRANEYEAKYVDAERNMKLAEARAEDAEKKAKDAELKMLDAEIERRAAESKLKTLLDEKENLLQELRGRLSKERTSELSLNKYKKIIEDDAKTRKNPENRCLELEKEVQQLKEQNNVNAESAAKLLDYQKMIVEKEQELKGYQELAAEKDRKLKIEWSNMNNTVQELTEMLRSHKARVSELNALTKQQENLILTQKDALDSKEEQVKLANQEVELVRNKSHDLDNQVKSLRQSVRSFEKFREERERRSVVNTPEELELSRRALENERDKLLIKDKIIEDQAETIKQLKATLSERFERLKLIEKELSEVREKAAELSGDVKRLTGEKEELVTEVVSLQETVELQSAYDSSNKDYDKHSEMLNQLESQVATSQLEWNQRLKATTEEKENALKAARLATSKLVETVDEFKRQIAMHKKVQRMLTSLLSEKEAQLSANSQKARVSTSHSSDWLSETKAAPPPPEGSRCRKNKSSQIRVHTSWSNKTLRVYRDKECAVSANQRRNWKSCSSKRPK